MHDKVAYGMVGRTFRGLIDVNWIRLVIISYSLHSCKCVVLVTDRKLYRNQCTESYIYIDDLFVSMDSEKKSGSKMSPMNSMYCIFLYVIQETIINKTIL